MASPSTPVHPARYLTVFLVLLVGAFALVFFTGDKQAKPKLGIDLQGGTRVTLTARTPDGSAPTREALDQAQQIISDRVNGLGVSGSEVIIDGNNLVITVPGSDSSEARNLGQTARLYIRPVIHVEPGPASAAAGRGSAGRATGRTTPYSRGAARPATNRSRGAGGSRSHRPASRCLAPRTDSGTATPPVSAGAAAHAGPTAHATSSRTATGRARRPGEHAAADAKSGGPATVERIADEKQLRQSTDQQIQLLALQFQATRCDEDDVLAGNDDPNLPLVTCSTDGNQVYLLDKSIISGEQIEDATSGLDQQQGQYVVDLQFKSDAAKVWADFTAANVGTQTAFVLDSKVVSAPTINEPIPGGRTQITGQFNQDSARELANVLKYGSLPLSFESSEAETVSATLGLTSLRAGLIAGAIGMALVLVYSLLYYRLLGVLTTLSLVASGAMVFAILVLLGRYINYTLDLAGIAGLIIGIGTTADSFVVFFERIKDEIREGRSFRSAVPRGWARARKTILSGNAVSFLAALVLYLLAVGQVKGFAFTLGLTTILDVVVVFLVTWPLVYMASKSTLLAKPALNGLGAVQQIARERRAAAHATGRG